MLALLCGLWRIEVMLSSSAQARENWFPPESSVLTCHSQQTADTDGNCLLELTPSTNWALDALSANSRFQPAEQTSINFLSES